MRKTSLKRGEVVINKTYHPIGVSRVYSNTYQKEGTETAEVKQIVETESLYPTKSVASNLQENVFETKEFGFASTSYNNKQTRVAWMEVPVGTSIEAVAERIAKFPEATIVQVLSNHPVLSDKQEYAIKNEITSKEVIAESQVMRFPEGSENAGKLILDSLGRPIYRGLYFRTTATEDVDNRSENPADFYATEAISNEMLEGITGSPSAMKEQTVFEEKKK